jgi:thiol-disulfide isomerase/thioredoxin
MGYFGKWSWNVAAMAMVMGGCGAAPPDVGPGAPTPDLSPVPYPSGPFGNRPGETLEDLEVEGYRLSRTARDAAALGWDTQIRLADYHADPRCGCLLISMGGVWCGACQAEQPALIQAMDEDADLCVLEIIQDGGTVGHLPSRQDVTAWADRYHPNYPVVMGNLQTGPLAAGYGTTIPMPFNFIVDPRTMRLLGEPIGGFDGTIHQVARARCDK